MEFQDYHCISPIHGLWFNDDVLPEGSEEGLLPFLKLSDDLEVRFLKRDEEIRLAQLHVIRMIGAPTLGRPTPAIHFRYRLPVENPERQEAIISAGERIQVVLDRLRIFKEGGAYLGGLAHWGHGPGSEIVDLDFRPWPPGVGFTFFSAQQELKDFEQFFLLCEQTPSTATTLRTPIHWFSRACGEDRFDDKLIGLFIAAECLAPSSRLRKSGAIADFISLRVVEPYGRHVLARKVIAAYRLRNCFIHQGAISPRWVEDHPDFAEAPSNLIFEVETWIRKIVKDIIHESAANG